MSIFSTQDLRKKPPPRFTLIKDEVGTSRPSITWLPPKNHMYGKYFEPDFYGVKEITSEWDQKRLPKIE